MGLIAVRFSTQRRGIICEKKLSLKDMFDRFIRQVVSNLVTRKIIKRGELYRSYVVPRYDNEAQFGRESVKLDPTRGTQLPDSDQREGWLSLSQARGEPMCYFTLELCTTPRGLVYTRDWPLSELDPYLDQLEQELLSEGVITRRDLKEGVQRELIAIDEFEMDPEDKHILIVVQPLSDALEESVLDIDDKLLNEVEIVEEPQTDSLPQRTLDEYDPSSLQRITSSGNQIVLITDSALAELQTSLKLERVSNQRGVLIGNPFSNPAGYLIEIKGIIPLNLEKTESNSVHFSHKMWMHAVAEQEQRFPKQQIVGWYRTHPAGTVLETKDVFVQRNFFAEPWQIMLSIGSASGAMVFYGWRGDEVDACSKVYVIKAI